MLEILDWLPVLAFVWFVPTGAMYDHLTQYNRDPGLDNRAMALALCWPISIFVYFYLYPSN